MGKEIEDKCFSMCFGGKAFFKKQHFLKLNHYKTHEKWRNDFRKRRNKSILYMGEVGNFGNQLLKFTEVGLTVTNHLAGSKEKITGIHNLVYLKADLLEQINNKVSTTYRFIKRRNRWCLQALVNIEESDKLSSSSYGTIGLDFNVGYITLSEIDTKGNLVSQQEYRYPPYQTHGKNLDTLRQLSVQIVSYAEKVGKDIVIEDLDFKKKRAKLQISNKAYSKIAKYNKMLTHLSYSLYTESITRRAYKQGIEVIKVNPAYTSRIASSKYCFRKKLNIHQGASYVIARRGKGFADKIR